MIKLILLVFSIYYIRQDCQGVLEDLTMLERNGTLKTGAKQRGLHS